MAVVIKEIISKKELRKFIQFPHKLYKNNPYWVPPLNFDEISTLDKEKNPAFQFCAVKYWLAYKNNKIAGRIAGIINSKYIEKWGKKYAQFGWIDFVDDYEVSKALLECVENWAKDNGLKGVQGPMGFTDFDRKGMLVEGFNELGCLPTIYNYPYYLEHLEKLSYKKEIDCLEFQIKLPKTVQEKVERIANIVKKRLNLRIVELKKAKDILPYTKDIFNLLNDTYKNLFGFVRLTDAQIDFYTKQYFSFIRPDFVSMLLDSNGNLAAIGITMPSFSKALQKTKGRIFPLGFLHLLRAIKKNDTADLYLVAVREDLQSKGLNAVLINEINKVYVKNNIRFVEATPQLEINKRVIDQWEYFDTRQHKRRRCFLKEFES